ncbi:unnamed protein product [Gadus morhua 'NCC']
MGHILPSVKSFQSWSSTELSKQQPRVLHTKERALGPCRVQIQPLPAQLWTPAHSSRTSAQASGSIEASHGCLLWSSQPKPELDAALFIMLVSLRRRPVAWLDMWADDREQERAVGQPASRR